MPPILLEEVLKWEVGHGESGIRLLDRDDRLRLNRTLHSIDGVECCRGTLAQLVEQRTENPRVHSSIL